MKGSLLDEVCLDKKGKPYLHAAFNNKSPEPRMNPVHAAKLTSVAPSRSQVPMKMFHCGGIGLRTAFSSPALWTQTHFKLISDDKGGQQQNSDAVNNQGDCSDKKVGDSEPSRKDVPKDNKSGSSKEMLALETVQK